MQMQSEKSIHLFHSSQRKTQAINFKMKRLLESFYIYFLFVKINLKNNAHGEGKFEINIVFMTERRLSYK